MKVRFVNKDSIENFDMIWDNGMYNQDLGNPRRAIKITLAHAMRTNAALSLIDYDYLGYGDKPVCVDIKVESGGGKGAEKRVKTMYENTCKQARERISMCEKAGCKAENMHWCCWLGKWWEECNKRNQSNK